MPSYSVRTFALALIFAMLLALPLTAAALPGDAAVTLTSATPAAALPGHGAVIPNSTAPAVPPSSEPGPIEDNSFLVEEAYNQEDGVIQHISFFQRLSTGDWVFTQTDEWPLRTIKHQLSLTAAGTHDDDDPQSGAGWGDTLVNYRYQLLGDGEARVAVAPRLSLILPTGSWRDGRGYGGAGLQTNLPLSIQHNRYFVTHWNVGATWIPQARNTAGDKARSVGVNLGQSMVWLINPRFNALLETVWYSNANVVSAGVTSRSQSLYVSPGIRWAYNLQKGNLQIVPGIGAPVGVGPSAGDHGVIFYLSFEHAYGLSHSR